MVDIKAIVLEQIKETLKDFGKNVTVTGSYADGVKTFPAVTVREIGNATYMPTATWGIGENHSRITYQIDCYSSLKNGKDIECRKLASYVDGAMCSLNFRRTEMAEVQNAKDANIYRITLRYRVVAGNDGILYFN